MDTCPIIGQCVMKYQLEDNGEQLHGTCSRIRFFVAATLAVALRVSAGTIPAATLAHACVLDSL